QRFRLTARGTEAAALWKAKLTQVRGEGKSAFDSALATWATEYKVRPDDAAFLSELSDQPLRLEDVTKAVADTGASRDAVKQALERLYDAGLMESALPT
ncbi:MAG: hypothetical protein JNG84_00645, partial [Archangium sp.]|nr:hypothetical protein [Archangium sp.]